MNHAHQRIISMIGLIYTYNGYIEALPWTKFKYVFDVVSNQSTWILFWTLSKYSLWGEI